MPVVLLVVLKTRMQSDRHTHRKIDRQIDRERGGGGGGGFCNLSMHLLSLCERHSGRP